ncbi:hypothetical protein H0H81_012291 [Sphagnurus paluster]|uniref:Fungal-type protein kinase domain-containing protein n=1 Tax=Sphagnurus paluster TaxID=117069 RepID=A0A9P7KJ58_9AGAR|nr:hypothetical protein H0H81_012291 [Sphagnurus paluster]
MSYPESLAGRCTRAYPVYEQATKRLFFLKDSWRAESLNPESQIIELLNECKVPHVPRFVCGGDLPDSTTITDIYVPLPPAQAASRPSELSSTSTPAFAERLRLIRQFQSPPPPPRRTADWKCGQSWPRITRRFHHRMVTEDIGEPLSASPRSFIMTKAVSQAFTGHHLAWEKCEVIHRDVSGQNVLIVGDGGILNDWDLAKFKWQLMDGRHHERTGTWQFMSSHLLLNKRKVHTIQDDMESFFYVMLYHCIRYLSHNMTDQAEEILNHIFDYSFHLTGSTLGGSHKEYLISQLGSRPPFEGFELSNNEPLNIWIEKAFEIFNEWLKNVDPPELKRLGRSEPQNLSELRLFDHQYMSQLFTTALSKVEEWPKDDKAVDHLPKKPHRVSSVTGISVGSGTRSTGSSGSGSKKRALSLDKDNKEGEEAGELSSTKRSKNRKTVGVSKTYKGSRSYHSSLTGEEA